MNFTLYNLLSQLITGFLLYGALVYFSNTQILTIDPLVTTATAYTLGYFINALAAWTQKALYKTWGGTPSDQLLKGGYCGQIKFTEHKRLNKLLTQRTSLNSPTNQSLFELAIRIANNEGRIEEMNSQYAFARALVAILLITLILQLFYYTGNTTWLIGNISLLLISWYRAKERGFYYAKEVLNIALNKLENKK